MKIINKKFLEIIMIEKKTKNRILMINKQQPAIYFELRYIFKEYLYKITN